MTETGSTVAQEIAADLRALRVTLSAPPDFVHSGIALHMVSESTLTWLLAVVKAAQEAYEATNALLDAETLPSGTSRMHEERADRALGLLGIRLADLHSQASDEGKA